MYELEILRLLHLFAPDDCDVRAMTEATLERLYHTCFGNEDDGVGECFDTNLVVIRYLCATSPHDLIRIRSRISVYERHRDEKTHPWYVEWYYRLCLSEAPYALSEQRIRDTLPSVQSWLTRENIAVPGRDADPTLLQAIARNMATRLRECPEFTKK